jgi:hypothetical protein
MQKRSVQLPLHFRLSALFRVKPTCKTCKPKTKNPLLSFRLGAGSLPCIARHCSALQSKAKQCSAEQRIALHGIAMQSSALQRKATHRKAMHGVIYCSTVSRKAALLRRKRHLPRLSLAPAAFAFPLTRVARGFLEKGARARGVVESGLRRHSRLHKRSGTGRRRRTRAGAL